MSRIKAIYVATKDYQEANGTANFLIDDGNKVVLVYQDKIVDGNFDGDNLEFTEIPYDKFQLLVRFNMGFGLVYDKTKYVAATMRFEPAYRQAYKFIRERVSCQVSYLKGEPL